MNAQMVFFDFGGCIDAPGIHSRTLFWEAFERHSFCKTFSKGDFQNAYSKADQQMMRTGEAKGMGLKEFNRWNVRLILFALQVPHFSANEAADEVTQIMADSINAAKLPLREIALKMPVGLISNFTGNLQVILREYGMLHLFSSITESYYEGCSKPDLKIFRSALGKHPFEPKNCVYVGDNPVNDIQPAKALGMQTVLIHAPGFRQDCGADAYIESIEQLLPLLKA